MQRETRQEKMLTLTAQKLKYLIWTICTEILDNYLLQPCHIGGSDKWAASWVGK